MALNFFFSILLNFLFLIAFVRKQRVPVSLLLLTRLNLRILRTLFAVAFIRVVNANIQIYISAVIGFVENPLKTQFAQFSVQLIILAHRIQFLQNLRRIRIFSGEFLKRKHCLIIIQQEKGRPFAGLLIEGAHKQFFLHLQLFVVLKLRPSLLGIGLGQVC